MWFFFGFNLLTLRPALLRQPAGWKAAEILPHQCHLSLHFQGRQYWTSLHVHRTMVTNMLSYQDSKYCTRRTTIIWSIGRGGSHTDFAQTILRAMTIIRHP